MAATATQPHGEDLDATYTRCMGPMLRKARRWFPTLRDHEADLYQAAWESVLRNRGRIVDVEKYLECALYSAA